MSRIYSEAFVLPAAFALGVLSLSQPSAAAEGPPRLVAEASYSVDRTVPIAGPGPAGGHAAVPAGAAFPAQPRPVRPRLSRQQILDIVTLVGAFQ